jgi:hypothetical protein
LLASLENNVCFCNSPAKIYFDWCLCLAPNVLSKVKDHCYLPTPYINNCEETYDDPSSDSVYVKCYKCSPMAIMDPVT